MYVLLPKFSIERKNQACHQCQIVKTSGKLLDFTGKLLNGYIK